MRDVQTDDRDNPKTMPAFPLHNGDVWGGMTLRDYFAAHALQGIIAANLACLLIPEASKNRVDGWTAVAYQMADEMLKARMTPIAASHEV